MCDYEVKQFVTYTTSGYFTAALVSMNIPNEQPNPTHPRTGRICRKKFNN
jgi:hypothetical protein